MKDNNTKYELAVLTAINSVKASGQTVSAENVAPVFLANVALADRLSAIHAEFDSLLAYMAAGNTVSISVRAQVEEQKVKAFDWAQKEAAMLAREQKQYDVCIAAFTAVAGAAIAGASGGGAAAMLPALIPAIAALMSAMSS